MADLKVEDIIMMAIGFFLIAILGPMALNEVFGANTTGWSATVKTIFQTLLPILWVIGCALYFVPRGRKR